MPEVPGTNEITSISPGLAGPDEIPALTTVAPHGRVRVVALWKGIEYVGLVLYTVVIPRIMGAERYGEFGSVVSLITLLVGVSGLGTVVVFGRYIPQYQAGGQWREMRTLFAQLFWTRSLLAGIMAVGLALLFPLLIPNTTLLVRVAAGGALLVGATATTCYQVFLGLNALGKSSVQAALTRIVLLCVIVLMGAATSLSGAITSLLLTQIGFLVVGVLWTRRYFMWNRALLDWTQVASHLTFGGSFLVANLLHNAVWRGDVLVLALSRQPTQAAYYNLANAAVMTIGVLFIYVAFLLVPTVTTMQLAGQHDWVRATVARLIKYLTIASVVVLLAVFALGRQIVGLLVGSEFLPAADSLRILAFGLPGLAVLSAGFCCALINKQPGRLLGVNSIALVIFLVASLLLIPRAGAVGAALAATVALASAGFAAAWQFSLAPILAEARFGPVIAIGALALASLAVPGVPTPALGALSLVLFVALLSANRLITAREIRDLLLK